MPLNAAIALDIYLYTKATQYVGSGLCARTHTHTAGQRMWFPLICVVVNAIGSYVQRALCSIIRARVIHLCIGIRYLSSFCRANGKKKPTFCSIWSWTSCLIRTNGAHNRAEWKATRIVTSNRAHQRIQMYILSQPFAFLENVCWRIFTQFISSYHCDVDFVFVVVWQSTD